MRNNSTMQPLSIDWWKEVQAEFALLPHKSWLCAVHRFAVEWQSKASKTKIRQLAEEWLEAAKYPHNAFRLGSEHSDLLFISKDVSHYYGGMARQVRLAFLNHIISTLQCQQSQQSQS